MANYVCMVGSEDYSKIAKFWAKITSYCHRSGDVDDVQWRSRFVQKSRNWWPIMGVWLYHWNQSPIIELKVSRWAKKSRKEHYKFGQMWRFCSLFSSIAMAWCIMNSCHMVVRPIRNTTLKLCADCAKQLVKNALDCGKTNHGFCTMITHQISHIVACAWIFGQENQIVI